MDGIEQYTQGKTLVFSRVALTVEKAPGHSPHTDNNEPTFKIDQVYYRTELQHHPPHQPAFFMTKSSVNGFRTE